MQQQQLPLYINTEISEIQTQINQIRNFILNNSVSPPDRRHALNQIQNCLNIYQERNKDAK